MMQGNPSMNDENNQIDAATVLAVDDDPNILQVLNMRLRSAGYRVLTAASGEAAIALAKDHMIHLGVLDYKLNGEDGVALMEKLQAIHPGLPVIIMTAYGTISRAVEAMKRGATNYLVKPFDGEELLDQIKHALESAPPHETPPNSSTQKRDYEADGRKIIARSSAMTALMEKAGQVAGTDSNVFVNGESGTGKELVARYVHAASKRNDGPFIAINCAAIPDNLLESELLGYEKGAFTGADRRREGLFSQAHGGSFFFDEISELPLSMQAKLLRILEEREFYPLGSNRKVRVDVRVIAASNRNLEKMVQDGSFREDLFYRIRVIPISLPPLRQRIEDIMPMARHFMAEFSKRTGKAINDLSPSTARILMEYAWPGNVRELENVIEYAVAMAKGSVITPDLLDSPLQGKKSPEPLRNAKENFEKDYLVQLMEMNSGNVSHAAEMAGKYRADFYALLRKHGLDPVDFRDKAHASD
jgi:two-component system, NtrC family, response regulator GlrR